MTAGVPTVRSRPHRDPQRGHHGCARCRPWYVAGTNTFLGSIFVAPHLHADHACVTPHRPCASGPGYVQVGRQYLLGGGW